MNVDNPRSCCRQNACWLTLLAACSLTSCDHCPRVRRARRAEIGEVIVKLLTSKKEPDKLAVFLDRENYVPK